MFMVANQLPSSPGYNPQPYNPARLDRKLTLGTAEEWKLTSNGGGPPLPHPRQPVRDRQDHQRQQPDGGLSASGRRRPAATRNIAGLKGMWKDTLWIKPGYTVTVRTRYERYIGDFVLHCHILDHEDQGMMQNVAIVLPGGTSASVNAPADAHGNH